MLNGKAKSLKMQQVTVVKLEEAIVRVITKFPQAENTIIFNNIEGCIYFNSTMRNKQGYLILIRKRSPMNLASNQENYPMNLEKPQPLELVPCYL